MGLPGHRRTSSHKHRRASHFALVAPALTATAAGVIHRSHRAAPGATEYNGIAIHVKGRERKLQKMLDKTKSRATKAAPAADHHDHDGHDHTGHDHA